MKTIVVVCLICAVTAWGQGTAQIHGVVQDMTGAAVPGASVKATQTETGATRTVSSDTDGGYVLTNLPIGPYNLEISKAGFTTTVQTGIVLQVNSDPAVPVALKIAPASDPANLSSNPPPAEPPRPRA